MGAKPIYCSPIVPPFTPRSLSKNYTWQKHKIPINASLVVQNDAEEEGDWNAPEQGEDSSDPPMDSRIHSDKIAEDEATEYGFPEMTGVPFC
ncbi:hypothetical protein Tco_0494680 [Tanacetum coccineum]